MSNATLFLPALSGAQKCAKSRVQIMMSALPFPLQQQRRRQQQQRGSAGLGKGSKGRKKWWQAPNEVTLISSVHLNLHSVSGSAQWTYYVFFTIKIGNGF